MSSNTKNKKLTGVRMKNKLTMASALVGLLCSLQAQASTTWIPIAVGDITTIIPYIPSGLLLAPANANVSIVNGVSTLSWNDVEHASKFEVQALNSQGQWVTLTVTEKLYFVLNNNYPDYSEFRVVACNYNTCPKEGNWSVSVKYKVPPIVIKYEYDALGRLRLVETPKNGTNSYDYDDAGNRKLVEKSL